jgi:hypothetical protein
MIEPADGRLQVSALLLLALTAISLQAQTQLPIGFGDIEITLQTVPQGASGHGYCEYVFLIRNQSIDRPHTVSLSIPFEKSFNRGDHIGELRRTVQVGAKETVFLSLWQPDHPPVGGRNAVVFIDGQRRDVEFPFKPNESRSGRGYAYYGGYSRMSGGEALLLIGSHVGSLPQQSAPTGGFGMGGGPGGGAAGRRMAPRPIPPQRNKGLPPNSHQAVNPESVETWSSNWLAYTRYDGVLVTADELKAMPAGVRDALWQYVETGGFLFVVGPADLRGLSAVAETKTDAAGWKSVRAGFGQCLVSPNARYDEWDHPQFVRLSEGWKNSLSLWRGPRGSTNAHLEFPVVEDLGIPVKGLFVLMLLFVLGIGPINLLMLIRWKRRIWMLWTTPLISLCTCAAVFGYMLISEGWHGQMRTETLTLLDETTHRATTIGWTGFYSPLTPGGGLHFKYETEVIPQRYFEDSRRGTGRSCTIDWSEDQHFAAGWIEARVPAHFKIRKSKIQRERVDLERQADGRWSMFNYLAADIRRFWYADDRGQLHAAEDVAAGAQAILRLTEKECQIPAKDMQSALSGNWMLSMRQMANEPQHYLRPGLYLAEVDDSPFLEDALPEAKKRKAHALILGFPSRER